MNISNKKIELLTDNQMKTISGGESGWYWVMYAAGTAVKAYVHEVGLASYYASAGH